MKTKEEQLAYVTEKLTKMGWTVDTAQGLWVEFLYESSGLKHRFQIVEEHYDHSMYSDGANAWLIRSSGTLKHLAQQLALCNCG